MPIGPVVKRKVQGNVSATHIAPGAPSMAFAQPGAARIYNDITPSAYHYADKTKNWNHSKYPVPSKPTLFPLHG